MTDYTDAEIQAAIEQLRAVDRGNRVLKDLVPFFEGDATGLDVYRKAAVLTLVAAFFSKPWTVRDQLTEAGVQS